ncbi:MAG TPA: alpha/beta hydrolase [Candidatus Limnocylindrales bacterium]|nr:alpha/beta hydrolase [Candidatus Limnocylindrales bacterium]
MMRTVLRFLWRSFLVLLAIVLVAVVILALIPARTPSLEGERAIASIEKWDVGGLEQAVLVRTADRELPALLYVASGPHMSSIPFSERFRGELEKHFLLVQWDPRGTGRSCTGDANAAPTMQALVSDTVAIAEAIRSRFAKDRVFLVGHSIGASVALQAAASRPELFAAVVAVSPVVHAARNEKTAVDLLREEAGKRGDGDIQAELDRLRLPYPDIETLVAQRQIVARYGGEFAKGDGTEALLHALRAPEYTAYDKARYISCAQNATRHFFSGYMSTDLFAAAPSFRVPVHFFLGRADLIAVPALVQEYAEHVDAPAVTTTRFEQSAHYPQLEEPQRFQQELIRALREPAPAPAQ